MDNTQKATTEIQNKTTLRALEAGDVFKIGEHEFFVLEHTEEGTAALYKNLLGDNVIFGRNNNFADDHCAVRQRLEELVCELEAVVGEDILINHAIDLTSDDGLDDYGTINAKMSLLTADQYRKYVRVIDKHKLNKWWWLATPYSTPTHDDDDWVKCVAPRGNIGSDYCIYFYDYFGVRPFCIFNSNIFVSI